MKPPVRLIGLGIPPPTRATFTTSATLLSRQRQLHTTTPAPATVSPVTGAGPPPGVPFPSADSTVERAERRKRQAAILEQASDIRKANAAHLTGKSKTESTTQLLKKRFWREVHVRDVAGSWEVHLDKRPLRHPTTKGVVRIPRSKRLLAEALALEWDMLVSAQQATMGHLVPLTSLVCRALDIAEDDAKEHSGVRESIRRVITRSVMRYLDTDSLLCWAPPPGKWDAVPGVETLRERQQRVAEKVIGFLAARVWPGVEIEPVLEGESLMPKPQKESTRAVIEGWVMGLSPWELAGLERGVLANKGLLGAVRLVVEWSEGFVGAGVSGGAGGEEKFGVEEAAKVASIEVDWQTGNWGEVEDTHDVEKEDLRRQLGSVVLLVSGTGTK